MNEYVKKLYSLLFITMAIAQTLVTQTTTTKKNKPCSKPAPIPYAKEFKKTEFSAAWGSMYAAYLAKSASTAQNSNEWQALKRNAFINNPFCQYTPLGQDPQNIQNLDICLDAPEKNQDVEITDCQKNILDAYQAITVNYLAELQTYLTTLPNNQTDAANIEYNYATKHLAKALDRLSKICAITLDQGNPVTHCAGDIRDLGIIVNITNNTENILDVCQQISYQNPIARIQHGLNGVNLHTAALYQDPTNSTQGQPQPIFSFFQISPNTLLPNSNKPLFIIGIYSGQQLIDFLKMLPRKDQNIFEMNGCPTSEEYLANVQDWYMVLIQNPTPATAPHRNLDQRIQAINLSTLTGPYLLTMQINETDIEQTDPNTKQTTTTKIIQPALTTVQVIQTPSTTSSTTAKSMEQNISGASAATSPNPANPKPSNTNPQPTNQNQTEPSELNEPKTDVAKVNQSLLPVIILPQFLWTNQTIQRYWMLATTSYIAALTDFSIFGAGNFGSAFNYYQELGYFSTDHEYRFIIDKYNILKAGESMYDATWLVGCAVYETELRNNSNIPQIYTYQSATGNMTSSANDGDYINLQINFPPQSKEKPNIKTFNAKHFNETYALPYHELWTYLFSLPRDIMQHAVFAQFSKSISDVYTLIWKNKENKILATQNIKLNFPIKDIQINFVTNQINWKKNMLPQALTNLQPNQIQLFKVIYQTTNNTHELLISPTSAIDQIRMVHTIEFFEYPLTDIYVDVYKTVNIAPYTRCCLFKNGLLPECLQKLTQQDWQQGIYFIFTVEHNKQITTQNPGFLTATFYKSNEVLLGSINIKGRYNNTTQEGILEPVQAYDLSSSQFKKQLDISLSSGSLLKYMQISQ